MMEMPAFPMSAFEQSAYEMSGISPIDMSALTPMPMAMPTPPLRMFPEPPQTSRSVYHGLSPAHSTGLNAFGYAESVMMDRSDAASAIDMNFGFATKRRRFE
jgi:hypothetical protein